MIFFMMLLKFFSSSLISLFLVDKFMQKNAAAVVEVDITYVEFFSSGVEAYNLEKWDNCVNFFTRAIADFTDYRKKITSCRRKCHAEGKKTDFMTNATDIESRFFEIGVRHTLCLVNCRKTHMRGRPNNYHADVDDAFERLVPYDYLQLCYYKQGKVNEAMTAALTFLHANPGHETMQHNIDFYVKDQGLVGEYSKNSEPRKYQELFLEGIKAFDASSFNTAMDKMELSLEAYLDAEEDCRVMCEGSFDQDGMQPDLYIAVANHMTYALKYRRRCHVRLQTFDGFNIAGASLFSRYYFYLETVYMKLDQIEEACHAAESYLLLNPKDDDMLKEKESLKALPDVEDDWFTPRPEAVTYADREKIEVSLMAYIEKEFGELVRENAADDAKFNLDGSSSDTNKNKKSKKHDEGVLTEDKSKSETEDFAF